MYHKTNGWSAYKTDSSENSTFDLCGSFLHCRQVMLGAKNFEPE